MQHWYYDALCYFEGPTQALSIPLPATFFYFISPSRPTKSFAWLYSNLFVLILSPISPNLCECLMHSQCLSSLEYEFDTFVCWKSDTNRWKTEKSIWRKLWHRYLPLHMVAMYLIKNQILTHYVACNLSNINEGTERFIFAHTKEKFATKNS